MLHRRAPARRFLPLLSLIAVLLVWNLPAFAQGAADAYTVRNVDVDVTAASAAEARDQAIAEAQRLALERLYRRLTAANAPPLPGLSGDEVLELVRNFEVERERSSPVRYVATLTVSFHPAAVRSLLQQHGIPFAEAPAKPVLVVPVTRQGETPILWEERTPWRAAWENAAPGDGLVQVTVPFGDLADVADVTAEEAVSGEREALEAMADRYDAGDVLVAVIEAPPEGVDPAAGAEVVLRQLTSSSLQPERRMELPPAPEMPVEDFLATAVAEVLDRLDREWKQATIVDSTEEHRMRVSIPVGQLRDWIQIRQQLAEVPLIVRTELKSLSRNEADVELVYRGGAERLRTTLAQHDLDLSQPEFGIGAPLGGAPGVFEAPWRLRKAGAAAP